MRKHHQLDRWAKTAVRAYAHGAEIASASTIKWDVAGNGKLACKRPVYREYVGRRAMKMSHDWRNAKEIVESRTLELDVRCRKCEACLEHRKLYWRALARNEIECSARTWFGTLTLAPDWQVWAQASARLRLASAGIDYDQATREIQFAESVAEIMPEITRWLKRVRKQSSVKNRQKARDKDGCTATVGQRCSCHRQADYVVPLKYLLVVEEHTGGGAAHGLPHFHLLLHEGSADHPIRHSVLEEKWKMGWSHFRLVPDAENELRKAANYVTKYLTKSILCRARASIRYGRHSPAIPNYLGDNQPRTG